MTCSSKTWWHGLWCYRSPLDDISTFVQSPQHQPASHRLQSLARHARMYACASIRVYTHVQVRSTRTRTATADFARQHPCTDARTRAREHERTKAMQRNATRTHQGNAAQCNAHVNATQTSTGRHNAALSCNGTAHNACCTRARNCSCQMVCTHVHTHVYFAARGRDTVPAGWLVTRDTEPW